tara:strand:+ start:1577 stop:1792 length:216 start_codon:yes stop_codon:yes gene_type:complete
MSDGNFIAQPCPQHKNGNFHHNSALFDFIVPGGLHARGYVSDIGFDELSIHATVNPIRDSTAPIVAVHKDD